MQGRLLKWCVHLAAGPSCHATRRQPPGRGLRLAVADPGQPDAAAGRLAIGLRRQPGRCGGGTFRVQRARRLEDHQPRHAVSKWASTAQKPSFLLRLAGTSVGACQLACLQGYIRHVHMSACSQRFGRP
jgi:hypothetical protein